MGTPIEGQINIVICDKSPLIRSGLRVMFEEDDRFRVVAEATDGERFMEAVERLTFDVAVIGWEMPYLSGAGVLERMREHPVETPRIIVYSGAQDPDLPRQVMALGGAGFCNKSEAPERLIETVIEVAEGRMSFPYVDVRTLANDPLAKLTPRERDLLGRLASGRTTAQIAADLEISPNTVKFHLKNLYQKIHANNRAQAVAVYMAATKGLTTDE